MNNKPNVIIYQKPLYVKRGYAPQLNVIIRDEKDYSLKQLIGDIAEYIFETFFINNERDYRIFEAYFGIKYDEYKKHKYDYTKYTYSMAELGASYKVTYQTIQDIIHKKLLHAIRVKFKRRLIELYKTYNWNFSNSKIDII